MLYLQDHFNIIAPPDLQRTTRNAERIAQIVCVRGFLEVTDNFAVFRHVTPAPATRPLQPSASDMTREAFARAQSKILAGEDLGDDPRVWDIAGNDSRFRDAYVKLVRATKRRIEGQLKQ